MKVGVVYPQTELRGDPDAVRQFGTAAEMLGYTHLLAFDHVLGAPHDRESKLVAPYTDRDPFHDPFILFAYLAGMTSKLEFAPAVLILPQRQTVLVAKQSADLDLMSGERFRLGVGTGWNSVEYEALGQDFQVRGARMTEQVILLRKLWEEHLVTFQGKYDRVDRAALLPRPKRRIPIWMGGFQEVSFRRAGQIGDGFIFSVTALDHVMECVARIKFHLNEARRDPREFGLEMITLATQSIPQLVETLERWRDLGGTHGAVRTLQRGFGELSAHLDFISEAAYALAQRGLLPK